MKKYIFALLAIVTIGMVSCNKKGCTDPNAHNFSKEAKKDDGSCHYHDDHDHEHGANMDPIHFHINSLNEGDSIEFNTMVMVHGTIESTSTIHGYKVELKNITDNNSIVYSEESSNHATTQNLNDHWTNDVTVVSDMEAIITAYKNHDKTMFETKTIAFVCKPS